MYSKLFWKDVFERLVATLAQVLVGLFTADGFDVLALDAKSVATVLITSGVLVVLKAVVAVNAVDNTVSPASLVTDNQRL